MSLLKKIKNNFVNFSLCYVFQFVVILTISACDSCDNSKNFSKGLRDLTEDISEGWGQPENIVKFKLEPGAGVDITNLREFMHDGSVEIPLMFTNNSNIPLNQEILKKIQIMLEGTAFEKAEYADSYRKLSSSQVAPHSYQEINNFSTTLWELFDPLNITVIGPGASVKFHLWLFPKDMNKRIEASVKLIVGMNFSQLNDKRLNNRVDIIWNPDITLKILDKNANGEELTNIRGLDPHNPGTRSISVLFINQSLFPLHMPALQDINIEFSNHNNISEILYIIQQRDTRCLVKPISNQSVSLAEILQVFNPRGILDQGIGKSLFFIHPADTRREASFTMQIKDKSNNLIDSKHVVWNP